MGKPGNLIGECDLNWLQMQGWQGGGDASSELSILWKIIPIASLLLLPGVTLGVPNRWGSSGKELDG